MDIPHIRIRVNNPLPESCTCLCSAAVVSQSSVETFVSVPVIQQSMHPVLVVAEHRLFLHSTHNTYFPVKGQSLFCLNSRKLGTAGQKLGGSAVLCHIKHDPMDPGGCFTLTSANVGKCQTVLCRNGKPLPLSRCYVMSCEEELKRIKQHKAIITEVREQLGTVATCNFLGEHCAQQCMKLHVDISEPLRCSGNGMRSRVALFLSRWFISCNQVIMW